jgi:glycosyltransferase involved in cell wall biosynthesis
MATDIQASSPVKRSWFKRLRYWLIPANSKQEAELWIMVKSARARSVGGTLLGAVRLVLAVVFVPFIRWLRPRGAFAGEPYLQDNSRVILYTNQEHLLPEYKLRRPFAHRKPPARPVSLITTLVNERISLRPWLESLSSQSRQPDELVIVDGGSTDGSLELLHEFAEHSAFPVTVISEPGVNIARGRNIAITNAAHDVIASSDLGCRLDPAWLENITAPFEEDPLTQVSAGWYEVIKKSRAKMELFGADVSKINPQAFLPSSRSIAFTKTAWETVDGYPEWVTLTGEDSFFDIELKRACRHWAFSPEAIVYWQAPSSLREYWHKLRSWSVGDGESLFGGRLYWHSLLRLVFLLLSTVIVAVTAISAWLAGIIPPWLALLSPLVWLYLASILVFSARHFSPIDLVSESGAEVARVRGFLQGARHRPSALAQRYQDVKGFFLILAGVPIDDTGGGARCTQIALELLRQGYAVFYINRFPKYESVDLDLTIYHPKLFTAPLAHFRWAAFKRNYRHLFERRPLAALLEFPLKEFLPIVNGVRTLDGVVIYDLLDDWNTSLGGDWYTLKTEQETIAASQVLVATEASLLERLEKLSQRPVELLPNAVNSLLFNPHRDHLRPDDVPEGLWSIIYIGALWGSWFDWQLLTDIAQAYPDASLVVIGDYRGQCPHPPANLHFLGLKAQRSLPAYLAHSQVAIIPWEVNAITQATSPLKVYEYLTMRKPVVAPNLRPLQGLPGVLLAQDRQDFIAKVAAARRLELPVEQIEAFTARNDWHARVSRLLELVDAARRTSPV